MDESLKKKLREWLHFFLLLAVVLILKIYIVTPVSVDGDSMYPTLYDNDYMILDKISYRFKKIERGDIVVLDYKKDKLVKRIIALPGETVSTENGKLYINGKLYEEKYLPKDIEQYDFKFIDITGKTKLDKDEYFVMGDNRPFSLDSRRLGPIKKKQIEGKVKLTLLPFTRIGIKK